MSFSRNRPNAHAELRAGLPCRPPTARGCRARWRSRKKRDAAGVTPCSFFSYAKERPACQLERGVRRPRAEVVRYGNTRESETARVPLRCGFVLHFLG